MRSSHLSSFRLLVGIAQKMVLAKIIGSIENGIGETMGFLM